MRVTIEKGTVSKTMCRKENLNNCTVNCVMNSLLITVNKTTLQYSLSRFSLHNSQLPQGKIGIVIPEEDCQILFTSKNSDIDDLNDSLLSLHPRNLQQIKDNISEASSKYSWKYILPQKKIPPNEGSIHSMDSIEISDSDVSSNFRSSEACSLLKNISSKNNFSSNPCPVDVDSPPPSPSRLAKRKQAVPKSLNELLKSQETKEKKEKEQIEKRKKVLERRYATASNTSYDVRSNVSGASGIEGWEKEFIKEGKGKKQNTILSFFSRQDNAKKRASLAAEATQDIEGIGKENMPTEERDFVVFDDFFKTNGGQKEFSLKTMVLQPKNSIQALDEEEELKLSAVTPERLKSDEILGDSSKQDKEDVIYGEGIVKIEKKDTGGNGVHVAFDGGVKEADSAMKEACRNGVAEIREDRGKENGEKSALFTIEDILKRKKTTLAERIQNRRERRNERDSSVYSSCSSFSKNSFLDYEERLKSSWKEVSYSDLSGRNLQERRLASNPSRDSSVSSLRSGYASDISDIHNEKRGRPEYAFVGEPRGEETRRKEIREENHAEEIRGESRGEKRIQGRKSYVGEFMRPSLPSKGELAQFHGNGSDSGSSLKSSTYKAKKRNLDYSLAAKPIEPSQSKEGSSDFEQTLTEAHENIIRLILSGKNVFITGGAGVGKTFIIKKILSLISLSRDEYAITASTGVSAIHIGGQTIQKFVGFVDEEWEKMLLRIKAQVAHSQRKFTKIKFLIIDEVSMLSNRYIDALDLFFRTVKNNSTTVFGGIQTVFCGDFFQLPPVKITPPTSSSIPFSNNSIATPEEPKLSPVPEKSLPSSHVENSKKDDSSSLVSSTIPYTATCNTTAHMTREGIMAFHSKAWKELFENNRHCIELTKIFRQQGDTIFQKILNEIRIGECSEETAMVLYSRSTYSNRKARRRTSLLMDRNTDQVKPVRLTSLRHHADFINLEELGNLRSESVVYDSQDRIYEESLSSSEAIRHIEAQSFSKKKLILRVGCQVILIKTINALEGLVNGLRGVVVRFTSKNQNNIAFPVVLFDMGRQGKKEKIITMEMWTVLSSQGAMRCSREQLPLDLAFAISIHKSQGLTLNNVEVNLNGVFEYGQLYVALSRATSLKALTITGIKSPDDIADCVKAHPDCVQFYRSIRKDKAGDLNV